MADKPITLTNREILKLHDGLRQLSGVASKPSEITRFEFSADLVWNIAKDESIAERGHEVYTKAKKSLAAKHKIVDGMKPTEENVPRIAAFVDEEEVLLDKTQELNGILRLSRTALQKGGVNIPSILKQLMPILTE